MDKEAQPVPVIQDFHYPDGSSMPLSNFYYHPMWIDGEMWRTNEHYFQAMKAGNPDDARIVRDTITPMGAKQAGRKVQLRQDWEAVKYDVMRTGLEHKFVAGEVLGDWLLATGDALLVEGNTWHDRAWGVCLCEQHNKTGSNWLGVLLMARRAELRGGM
jgi:ribA/ribD-fused uncharacterized protein